MSYLFRFFTLSLLYLFSASTLAAEVRYYDIELIVFETLTEQERLSEVWKNQLDIEQPERFVELGRPYPGPIPKKFNPKHSFKPLRANRYQLSSEAKSLVENGNRRILLHTAWRQPGMNAKTALPIRIRKSFTNTPTQTASDSPFTQASPATKSELSGFIKIILSRYLHAEIDLAYTTGLPLRKTNVLTETNNEIIEPTIYHLKTSRKMRSKELHYIDHPTLGIVVLATPYKTK